MKAVIFDWGGVLIEHPSPKILQYCASHLQVEAGELYLRLKPNMPDFQRGILKEAELWKEVSLALHTAEPEMPSLWGEAFRAAYSPREEMFALARQLQRSGYATGFLSNTEKPARDFFLQQHYGMFHAAIFSCDEGLVKPEKRIYEIAAERLRVALPECVFIDDHEDFVKGAEAAGMQGIIYETLEQVRKELAESGVIV